MNNHTPVEKIQPTGIFTNYIFKALPLAFDESMSYYECLCNLLDYLKNTVIPTVNNNADAVIELQVNVDEFETSVNNSIEDFETTVNNSIDEFETTVNNTVEELENYMNNYFTNLDVQDEINNKIDQMVLNGTMDALLNTNLTGSLTDLNTTDKSNLVSAINEVNSKVGNLSNLNTTDKSNLVDAINEATHIEIINDTITLPAGNTSVTKNISLPDGYTRDNTAIIFQNYGIGTGNKTDSPNLVISIVHDNVDGDYLYVILSNFNSQTSDISITVNIGFIKVNYPS